jgi:hypothetical protein
LPGPEALFEVVGEAETPTLTKEKRSLGNVRGVGKIEEDKLPECSFSADRQILKDKPDTDSVIGVSESERAGCQTADQIPREHSLWCCTADWNSVDWDL